MNGIIYYNTGKVCLVRLLVSIYSLRRFYSGPVSILSWGEESNIICDQIANATAGQLIKIDPKMVKCDYPKYMAKTVLHEFSPYHNTVYFDTDTVIQAPIDDLFSYVDQHSFMITEIAGWSSRNSRLFKRITEWGVIYPDLVEPALNFGKAINCGVFGFRSDATIIREWYKTAAIKADSIMPDEISLQLLLPHHKHIILDNSWNFITKRGDTNDPRIKILHYQARKHCQGHHCDKWLKLYHEVERQNLANVRAWQPADDPKLAKYLRAADVH